MQIGRCCQCDQRVPLITLKGVQSSDGVTQWEWGQGMLPAKVYGASTFVAIKQNPDASDNLTTRGTRFDPRLDSITDSYDFNANISLRIATIDGTSGAETTAGIDWLLSRASQSTGSSLFVSNLNINSWAGTSDGHLAFVGYVEPAIIHNTRTSVSTTATKTYKLLPHTLQGGNVTFRTRATYSTITAAHNATASAIASAFAAHGEVSSASATGGPWPSAAIDLSVTWATASNAIWGRIEHDGNYVISTTPLVYRSTQSACFLIDGSTGDIHSTIPAAAGNGIGSSGDYLFPNAAPFPGSTSPRNGDFGTIASAAAGQLVFTSEFTPLFGSLQRSVEAWTYSGGVWSQSWVRTSFSARPFLRYLHVEGNTACVSVPRHTYNYTTLSAVLIDVATGNTSHSDPNNVSMDTNPHVRLKTNSASAYWMYDAVDPVPHYPRLTYTPSAMEVTDNSTTLLLGVNAGGEIAGTISDGIVGRAKHSGGPASADPVELDDFKVRTSVTNVSLANTAGYGRAYYLAWPPGTRHGGATEWRFRFRANYWTSLYTSWLAWDATEAQIEAAIIATLGENTEGLYSNVNVWPISQPTPDNTAAAFEIGLRIVFLTSLNPATDPWGFIDPQYITQDAIRVQTRYAQQPNSSPVCVWNDTDGSIVWSRNYGTLNGSPVGPSYLWTDGGSWVWMAGAAVDSELGP